MAKRQRGTKGARQWSKLHSSKRRAIRNRLASKQLWLCYWCGRPMKQIPRCNGSLIDEDHVTIDHLVALSEGGDPFDERNLAAAHHRCNHERHHAPGSLKPKEAAE